MASSRRYWLILLAIAVIGAACGSEEPASDTEEPAEAAPDTVEDDDSEEPEPDESAWEPTARVTTWVTFGAGGGADASQRLWNEYAQGYIDQSLTVVNREGAGGVTGWVEFINEAPTDGHDITLATPPFNVLPKVINPDQTNYEHEDFTYICTYSVLPETIYVQEDAPWADFDEFVEDSMERPGEITIATTGPTSADAIAMGLLRTEGIDVTQVPLEADSVGALLAGTVDAMIGSIGFIRQHEGSIRPLAITTEERYELYPDLPTFREYGYDIVTYRLRALAGPPGIDEGAVEYWARICEEVSEDPEFRQAMEDAGNPPVFLGPEDTTSLVQQIIANVEAILPEMGLG